MSNGNRRESMKRGWTNRRTLLKTAGIGTISALAGCSGNNGSTAESGQNNQDSTKVGNVGTQSIELEIWTGILTESPRRAEYVQKVSKAYEKENPNVSITWTGVPYADMAKKWRSAQAAGTLPEMLIPETNPGLLADTGMQINEFFEGSKTQKKVSKGVMDGQRVWGQQLTGNDGALVTWPIGIQPFFPIWRMDWLNQAGISRDEVDATAGTLDYRGKLANVYDQLTQTELGQKDGYYPSSTGMKLEDCEYLSMYIPQFGGSLAGVVNEKGTEATINSSEARKAIKMQFDFIDKGYFHKNSINFGDEEGTTTQWAGKVAENHIQDSGDSWSGYVDKKPDMMKNMKFAWTLPYSGGTKATLAWSISLGFVKDKLKDQKKKEAATGFADFWASDSRWAKKNASKMGLVPLNPKDIRNKDWFGQSEMHKEFWRDTMAKIVNNYKISTIPAVPAASAITYDIPAKMYQRISRGESIEKATDIAAEEINSVLKQHGRR